MIIIKLYKGKDGAMPVKRDLAPRLDRLRTQPQTSKPLSEETIRQGKWSGERFLSEEQEKRGDKIESWKITHH